MEDDTSPVQPRRGERVQPTAQAVGKDRRNAQAPAGRKTAAGKNQPRRGGAIIAQRFSAGSEENEIEAPQGTPSRRSQKH
jgi:hypothetical protein